MLDRLAAAPISWGICEAPGWGLQLAPERVLGEMRELGVVATELGALGWLPTDPAALRDMLDGYGLQLVGGFVPLVLHRADARDRMRRDAEAAAALLAPCGARHFVTAVVSSHEAWERPALDVDGWSLMLEGLEIVEKVCADAGLQQVVHPHVDTLIETADEVQRFIDHSPVSFTLDTGHLFIGGCDTVDLARRHHDRVGLVHIKDVDPQVAARMRAGELTLMTATAAGLFPPAGQGAAPIADTIAVLEGAGYRGWYVLEQDRALSGEPSPGEGPRELVLESIVYLRSLAA